MAASAPETEALEQVVNRAVAVPEFGPCHLAEVAADSEVGE